MVSLFKSFREFSSRTISSLDNYYLRKRRKSPLSPYKSKWHEEFSQRQAMRALKESAKTPSINLLSSLIESFSIYNSDPSPNAYRFVVNTLARNFNWDQISQVLDHLEKQENLEIPEYLFADLIVLYGGSNMFQHAVELFFRIPSFRCIPTVLSLNALLSVLCKNREGIRIVPQILLKIQFMNIRVEQSSFNVLIKALCRIKQVRHAIHLLKFMIDDGFSVDEKAFSLILSTLGKQTDNLSCLEVKGFFEELTKSGLCPRMIDWCNMIRFLIKIGKGVDALDVLGQMKMEGIKPNIFCYTMVLHGVILEGQYDKAEELFDELLVLGLVPDIYTFNVYISGLCNQNKAEEGIKMLGSMEELGCRPDLITYNTLLRALCDMGELNGLRKMLRDMELKGVQLNSQSYNIMINGLVRGGEIDEACLLLEEMVHKHLVPSSSTFDDIICWLCQRGLACKAVELIKKMDNNVSPGAKAWEALLHTQV